MSVVLVVGASSGLGKATALQLLAEGHRVYGTSRTPERYGDLGFPLLPLDVRSSESVAQAVETLLQREGRLDVLVNCAGYEGPCAAVEETSEAQGRALMETNFFGAVRLLRAVLPVMRKQGGGKIINITSIAGPQVPTPFFAFYAASKAALDAFSESLRLELLPLGITLSVVQPGFFRTAIHRTMEPPAHPLPIYRARRSSACRQDRYAIRHGGDPRAVGRLIARIVREPHPRFRYLAGNDAHLTAQMRRLLPASLFEGMLRLVLDGEPLPDGVEEDEAIAEALGWRRLFLAADALEVEGADRSRGLLWLLVGGLVAVWWFLRHRQGGKE